MNNKKYLIIFFLILFIFSFQSNKTSRSEIVSLLFKTIEKWFGTDYKLGGQSKEGIDCSGFVALVYKEAFNIDLPRRVSQQKVLGEIVKNQLQPGDLLFFKINDSISHVGVFIFNNKFVHAASSGPEIGVIKSSLNEKYYKDRFAFARRLINLPTYKKKDIKNKNIQSKIELLIGKNNYKGKVFNLGQEFKNNENIYMEIKTNDKTSNICRIEIYDNNQNLIKKIFVDTSKETLKDISLKNGSYVIKLFNESDPKNLSLEKNILVK